MSLNLDEANEILADLQEKLLETVDKGKRPVDQLGLSRAEHWQLLATVSELRFAIDCRESARAAEMPEIEEKAKETYLVALGAVEAILLKVPYELNLD